MKMKIALALMAAIPIAGCTTYGVRDSVWKEMGPDQRKLVMEKYYENQNLQTQKRLEEAAAVTAREQRLLLSMSEVGEHRKQLSCKLIGGKILWEGTQRFFDPVNFTIRDGEIKRVSLLLENNQKVDIFMEYADKIFWFNAPSLELDYSKSNKFIETEDWYGGSAFYEVDTKSGSAITAINVGLLLKAVEP